MGAAAQVGDVVPFLVRINMTIGRVKFHAMVVILFAEPGAVSSRGGWRMCIRCKLYCNIFSATLARRRFSYMPTYSIHPQLLLFERI